jgi:hypothetical protein
MRGFAVVCALGVVAACFSVADANAAKAKRKPRKLQLNPLTNIAQAAKDAFTISDAESADFNLMQKLMKTDPAKILTDMMDNKDLDTMFQAPGVAKALMDNIPVLQALRGLDDIKGKDVLTPDDVSPPSSVISPVQR